MTISFTTNGTTVRATVGPASHIGQALSSAFREHARLVDDLGFRDADGTSLVLEAGSSDGDAWPDVIVALRFEPGPDSGFFPGVTLIPETKRLLIGAGELLLAYDLATAQRLWEDRTAVGFWGWDRVDEVILMAAELELAAFDLDGDKRWATFVEPPWRYRVVDSMVELDVMGRVSTFNVYSGPPGA